MFLVGQKVVCVNDSFPLEVKKYYRALPRKGVVYVIRGICIGIGLDGQPGELCVYLVGLENPRSSRSPYPERGFAAWRFRPLEELTEEEIKSYSKEEKESVPSGGSLDGKDSII